MMDLGVFLLFNLKPFNPNTLGTWILIVDSSNCAQVQIPTIGRRTPMVGIMPLY